MCIRDSKEIGSEAMREGVGRGSFVLRVCICFCMRIYVYGVVYVLWHNCGVRGRAPG